MTQGTKIGLLVSLVFLIAILVLLSDHVATTSDAKPAQVTAAGPQVAQAITTPGPRPVPSQELVASAVDIAPTHPVPTVQEMVRPAPPRVAIGPAAIGELEIRAANNNVPVNVRVASVEEPPVQIGEGSPVVSLAEAARPAETAISADFVPVGPTQTIEPAAVSPAALAVAPQASEAVAPKSFEHTARPGDTVSKMARKYYGLDTKTNRDLIIAANKTLKSNPNKIEVGKNYTIPVKPGSISAAQAAAAPIAAAIATPVIATPAAPEKPAAERIYVVKNGDNLWKIAKEQCKDVGKLAEIKKMNAAVLKNGVDLKVGTKLRLPAE